jgi:multidrug efflux system membrane fusion protein
MRRPENTGIWLGCDDAGLSRREKNIPMKHVSVVIWVTVAVGIAAVATAVANRIHHGKAAPHVVDIAAAPIPVVSSIVQMQDVPIYLQGIGTVVAYNTDVVRSQISGQLISIDFKEGQPVRVGDVLAVIDPKPYQAKVDEMVANRNRDQAALSDAVAKLNRSTQLISKGFATQQLIDTQKAQVDQLQAAVQADDALIEQAKVELVYTQLTSPISGITGIRRIDIGNVIHPSDAAGLVTITQIEPISLLFTLPERELTRVQTAMAKQTPAVVAYSQDGKNRLDDGTLVLINNEIIEATGSIQLKAQFANGAHRLWPGQLVIAQLLVDTQQNGLTVASSAVQQGPGGAYVYVIGADGKAEFRPVEVSQIDGGRALISSGLQANENIVIDGQYRLQNGNLVHELHGKAAREADLDSAVEKAIP